MRFKRSIMTAGCTAWLLACGGEAATGPNAPLAPAAGILELMASSPELRPGERAKLSVRLIGADGTAQVLDPSRLSWSSSDETVLQPRLDGDVVAGREGSATLQVRHGAVSTSLQLRVASIPQEAATFAVDLRLTAEATDALRLAAERARVRWHRLLRAMPAGRIGERFDGWRCDQVSMPATRDTVALGVIVVVSLDTLAPGVLASTTPCAFRDGTSRLPSIASVRLSRDFVLAMSSAGRGTALENVLVHEFAHAWGFGGALSAIAPQLLAPGADLAFTGARAREAFEVLGGRRWSGVPVPFETAAGLAGHGHWRHAALAGEVMTATLGSLDVRLPISAITLAALADLGYVVDLAAAESYLVPAPPVSGFAAH